jgi:hypothetical protein
MRARTEERGGIVFQEIPLPADILLPSLPPEPKSTPSHSSNNVPLVAKVPLTSNATNSSPREGKALPEPVHKAEAKQLPEPSSRPSWEVHSARRPSISTIGEHLTRSSNPAPPSNNNNEQNSSSIHTPSISSQLATANQTPIDQYQPTQVSPTTQQPLQPGRPSLPDISKAQAALRGSQETFKPLSRTSSSDHTGMRRSDEFGL